MTPPTAQTPAGANRRSGDGASRNASFALVTQLTTAAFTAGLTLVLVRVLGPRDYGVLALALGIGTLVNLPSDFGVSQSVARFIAERRDDPAAVARLLGSALRLKLPISTAVAAGLMFASAPIAHAYHAPELTWPLRAVALAGAGQGIMFMFARVLEAVGRVSINTRIVFLESAAEMGASVALVVLMGGATAAAAGRAAGYVFGAVMAVALALRRLNLPRRARLSGGRAEMATIIRYAAALMIVDGAFTLFSQIDTLLIGAYLGAVSVAYWTAPMRLVTFLGYPGIALASGVAPRLAGAQDPRHVAHFESALRGLVVLQSLLVAPLLVWAEPIVRLTLGTRYGASAGVLRAITPFVFLGGLASLTSIAVDYLGQARKRIPIALATVAINFVIDAILIPRIGVIGGAIGTDTAYLLYVPAHFLICRRSLGLALRPLAVTFGRSMLAAGAMAAVLALIGRLHLGLAELPLGLPVGAATFLAVLCVVGELRWSSVHATASRALRAASSAPRWLRTRPSLGRLGAGESAGAQANL